MEIFDVYPTQACKDTWHEADGENQTDHPYSSDGFPYPLLLVQPPFVQEAGNPGWAEQQQEPGQEELCSEGHIVYLYRQRDGTVRVEAATQGDVTILVEEVGGHQRNPKGDHNRPHQACEPARLSQSNAANAVMRMDHLKVAMQCHSCHKCNTGRAIDSQHEKVNAAPDLSKHPVHPSEFGVDAEGHADEEQEVG